MTDEIRTNCKWCEETESEYCSDCYCYNEYGCLCDIGDREDFCDMCAAQRDLSSPMLEPNKPKCEFCLDFICNTFHKMSAFCKERFLKAKNRNKK